MKTFPSSQALQYHVILMLCRVATEYEGVSVAYTGGELKVSCDTFPMSLNLWVGREDLKLHCRITLGEPITYSITHTVDKRDDIAGARECLIGLAEDMSDLVQVSPALFRVLDDCYECAEEDIGRLELDGRDKVFDYTFSDLDHYMLDSKCNIFHRVISTSGYRPKVTRVARNEYELRIVKNGEVAPISLLLDTGLNPHVQASGTITMGQSKLIKLCALQWVNLLKKADPTTELGKILRATLDSV